MFSLAHFYLIFHYFFAQLIGDKLLLTHKADHLTLTVLIGIFLCFISPKASADSLGGASMSVTQGVYNATLGWSIAGIGKTPNILSELQWKRLRIYNTQISSEIWFENSLVINASIGRGKVLSGTSQDSDYLLDNRQAEFSRSFSDTGGSTKNSSVALGLRYLFIQPSSGQVISITPKIGYQLDRQHLTIKNGRQAISGIGNNLNPQPKIQGLNSSYTANWRGPWLGMEYRVHGDKQQLIALVRYHHLDYTGRGNWNLRSDFQHPVSFKHQAKSQGLSLDIDYERRLTKNLWAKLKVSYQLFKSHEGDDTTYFSDGNVLTTSFRQARHEQIGIQLGTALRF